MIKPTCRRSTDSYTINWACWAVLAVWAIYLPAEPVFAADEKQTIYEINTVLMETTFRIEGQGSSGTAFILGRPYDGDLTKSRYVLVTAAHVLDSIKDDFAKLHLRKAKGATEWQRFPSPIKIRNGGKALWTRHPEADVAVMYIEVPDGLVSRQLGTPLLADDDTLQRFDIHPGDNLNCLGFPFNFESGKEGFPILRSGRIASYPLLPTKQTKTFLFDFEVFRGNSGGPVYFVDSNRFYKGTTHLGETIQFLVGLVSGEILVTEELKEFYGKREQNYPLKLAQVVHASLIKETIGLLP